MATFYTPANAVAVAKSLIKKMSLDTTTNPTVAYQIADAANSLMWYAAPWYWTLGQLGNVTLTASAQDYATAQQPTDFLYLHRCQVTDGANLNEVTPVAQLPTTEVQIGNPSQVSQIFTSGTNLGVRFWPRPSAGEARIAVLQYKRSPSVISSTLFATSSAFAWPDVYYPVYQEGVLWAAYRWADDQRAGGAETDENGKTTYTGVLGSFMAMLHDMRRAEKLPLLNTPQQPQLKG